MVAGLLFFYRIMKQSAAKQMTETPKSEHSYHYCILKLMNSVWSGSLNCSVDVWGISNRKVEIRRIEFLSEVIVFVSFVSEAHGQ